MRSEGKNHLNSIAYVNKQIDLKEASERKKCKFKLSFLLPSFQSNK